MISKEDFDRINKFVRDLGYTFKESIEEGVLTVKIYRPDGTLAMTATKPVPTNKEKEN
jgi:hypothetical protein